MPEDLRTDGATLPLDGLRDQLLFLLAKHPSENGGLSLAELKPLYTQTFKKKLEPQQYGFEKLSDLIFTLSPFIRTEKKKGNIILYPALKGDGDSSEPTPATPAPSLPPGTVLPMSDFKEKLLYILDKEYDEGNFSLLGSEVKPKLRQYLDVNFDPRVYGHFKLVHILRECQDIIIIERKEGDGDVCIRRRQSKVRKQSEDGSPQEGVDRNHLNLIAASGSANGERLTTFVQERKSWSKPALREALLEECLLLLSSTDENLRITEAEAQRLRQALAVSEERNRFLQNENVRLRQQLADLFLAVSSRNYAAAVPPPMFPGALGAGGPGMGVGLDPLAVLQHLSMNLTNPPPASSVPAAPAAASRPAVGVSSNKGVERGREREKEKDSIEDILKLAQLEESDAFPVSLSSEARGSLPSAVYRSHTHLGGIGGMGGIGGIGGMGRIGGMDSDLTVRSVGGSGAGGLSSSLPPFLSSPSSSSSASSAVSKPSSLSASSASFVPSSSAQSRPAFIHQRSASLGSISLPLGPASSSSPSYSDSGRHSFGDDFKLPLESLREGSKLEIAETPEKPRVPPTFSPSIRRPKSARSNSITPPRSSLSGLLSGSPSAPSSFSDLFSSPTSSSSSSLEVGSLSKLLDSAMSSSTSTSTSSSFASLFSSLMGPDSQRNKEDNSSGDVGLGAELMANLNQLDSLDAETTQKLLEADFSSLVNLDSLSLHDLSSLYPSTAHPAEADTNLDASPASDASDFGSSVLQFDRLTANQFVWLGQPSAPR